MPINAKKRYYEALEIGVGGSFTLPTDPFASGSFSADLKAYFTPDVNNVSVGTRCLVAATTDSGGSWQALIRCPNEPFGGVSASGSGLPTSLWATARYIDWTIYNRYLGANYRTVWSAIEIWINGSLYTTLSGGYMESAGLGPQYVAPFCGLLSIEGGATAEFNEAAAVAGAGGAPYDISASVSAGGTVSGGYRFKIGGTWYGLPTKLPPVVSEPAMSANAPGPPGIPGPLVHAPYQLHIADQVHSTSTWGSQIDSYYDIDYHGVSDLTGANFSRTRIEDKAGGALIIIPNPPRGLVRVNPNADFLASLFHWKTPEVRSTAGRFMSNTAEGAATAGASMNLYEFEAAGAEELGQTPGHIDFLLSRDAYCGVITSHDKEQQKNSAVGGVPQPTDNKREVLTYFGPNFDSDSSVTHNCTPFLEHDSALIRYFGGIVGNPGWSIQYNSGNWEVQGNEVRWAPRFDDSGGEPPFYWGRVREQYCSEQGRRNHIVSCPLEVDNFQQFLDTFNVVEPETSGKRFFGVSRFRVDEVTPPASVAMKAEGSSLWSSIDDTCTLSFGSGGITVTGTEGTTAKIRMKVGSFTEHPFLFPLICDRIKIGWDSDGSPIRIYAANAYGDRAAFARLRNHQIHRVPVGLDSKYAGTWGFDNGIGAATDGGTDQQPNGVSAALCVDPESVHMFRMLGARSPAFIEFEIDFAAGQTSALIEWPEWQRANGKRVLEAENGSVQSFIWSNGPGIRMGSQFWWDGAALVNPPVTNPLGYKWTLIDWLCFKRLVLLVEPYDGGTPDLTTELTNIFDTFEGQSVALAAFSTFVWILPSPGPSWKAACVHALAEDPPLSAFPERQFDANWERTGNWWAGVYAWSQGPRRITAAGPKRLHMFTSGGTQLTTNIPGVTGWSRSVFNGTVDNTEMPDRELRFAAGGTLWAKVTPWHGYLATFGWEQQQGNPPAYDVSDSMRHLRAYVKDGTLFVGRASQDLVWDDLDTGVAADPNGVALAIDKRGRHQLAIILAVVDGDVNLYTTDDEGRTLTLATTLGAGILPGATIDRNSLRYLYRLDGTDVKGEVRDAANNVVRSEFVAISGVDEDGGIAVQASILRNGKWRLVALTTVGGDLTQYVSDDGVVFV